MSVDKQSHEYQHFLQKAREARDGGIVAWRVQSTGEKVAVALALNRADWLTEIGYTIPEAIERTGSWLCYLSEVARDLAESEATVSDTKPIILDEFPPYPL